MHLRQAQLPDIILVEPRLFKDERGYFLETYQQQRYTAHGIPAGFVQDNLSVSRQSVVRGLHYQLNRPQGKLIMVLQGEVVDLVVDIRLNSPTFGKWTKNTLSGADHVQLYVPPGFAHGFFVTSPQAVVLYKVTDYYQPGDEYGIFWNDPDLKIDWPSSQAILSARDQSFPRLRDIPQAFLPKMPALP